MSLLSAPTVRSLEADALMALTKVQGAVKRMVWSLPGPIERPSHLQHCLEIDAKVAWHMFKLAVAQDPLAAAPHVPGRLLMNRIGQASLRKGVSPSIVELAKTAIGEFDLIVKRHASTRTAFKAIVANVAGEEPAEAMALQQRHAAFNVESQLWGEQVDLHYNQAIHRRKDDSTTTSCVVTFKSGLQRLRADASSWVEGYISADGTSSAVQPLEPQAAEVYGGSLMPSFCSQPVPLFHTDQKRGGWRHTVVRNKNIGRRGAVDLAFGRYIATDMVGRLANGDALVIHGTAFICPTATAVLEFLVHRPSFPTAVPEFAIFGEQNITTMEKVVDDGRRLPTFGVLQKMGKASTVIAPPHEAFPRYEELNQHVFKKLGWDREEFDLYRVVLNYPILHTTPAIWIKV